MPGELAEVAAALFKAGPLYLPPAPSIVGTLGRTEGPRVVAGATLAFLDAVLRGRPGDPADTLRAYGKVDTASPSGDRGSADLRLRRGATPTP